MLLAVLKAKGKCSEGAEKQKLASERRQGNLEWHKKDLVLSRPVFCAIWDISSLIPHFWKGIPLPAYNLLWS